MVLGPIGTHHLLPDSIPGLLVLVVVMVGIERAYTGKPVRSGRFSAVALLFATNLIVFVLQGVPFAGTLALVPPLYPETLRWNALVPFLVVNGHTWWSPLTSMFMHGSLLHLFGNMLLFWIIGVKIERRIGRRGFVLLYLVSGLFADLVTIASVYLVPPAAVEGTVFHLPSAMGPSLGASGAVYGLIGFSILAFPKEKILVPTPIIMTWWPAWAAAIFYVAFNFYIGLTSPQVAWWAHLAGMLIGAVWGSWWRMQRGRRSSTGAGYGSPTGDVVHEGYLYRGP